MRGCSLMGVPSRSGGVAEELGRSLSPSGTMTSSSYCNLYYYCRRLVCIDGDERASASRLGAGSWAGHGVENAMQYDSGAA